MRINSRKFALFVTIVLILSAASAHGQDRPSLVLMCLSSHPDDEDGGGLAYYAKLKGVTAYSLFFTRGEGGQNETGSQLYEDLGAIREKEATEASNILGAKPYFLGFPDFGFSKTAKETFKKWGGEDSVLARLVLFIRCLKPDVIITIHDTITTKPNRQHGNHQAVGIVAFEAFEKAADKNYHPEQLTNGITPWQVKRLFFRSSRNTFTSIDSVIIDFRQHDSSGTSIEQVAIQAMNRHRSQGFANLTVDSMAQSFRTRRYKLVRSIDHTPLDHHDLFFGILPSKRITIPPPPIPMPAMSRPLDQLTKESMAKSSSTHISDNAYIGLVKTYDNTLEETLNLFHIKYQFVDSTMLAAGDLSKFTTVVLDLRTYFYRSDAVTYSANLLAYARNGGNIICFYHKPNDWNGKNFSPYPIMLTGERVTEEDATVTPLSTHHPLLNSPNTITAEDWDGWVQERSIYLPSDDTTQTSAQYLRLLGMSDTDDKQPPTSLLWAQYGKGTYTYVSLALYRQLRNLNKGSVKLLFNLLSPPKLVLHYRQE